MLSAVRHVRRFSDRLSPALRRPDACGAHTGWALLALSIGGFADRHDRVRGDEPGPFFAPDLGIDAPAGHVISAYALGGSSARAAGRASAPRCRGARC
ncbi:hypothetical protein ACRAWF_28985 [Streptomyces sp. L7]